MISGESSGGLALVTMRPMSFRSVLPHRFIPEITSDNDEIVSSFSCMMVDQLDGHNTVADLEISKGVFFWGKHAHSTPTMYKSTGATTRFIYSTYLM
jgi:hypothetical protein